MADPVGIAGCKLWLKSDSGITKDASDFVSAWEDQSGTLNNLAQTTASKQPLYVANELYGYPVIRFDGIDDDLIGLLSPLFQNLLRGS